MEHKQKLRYQTPARTFSQALPIGNGSLGSHDLRRASGVSVQPEPGYLCGLEDRAGMSMWRFPKKPARG